LPNEATLDRRLVSGRLHESCSPASLARKAAGIYVVIEGGRRRSGDAGRPGVLIDTGSPEGATPIESWM
jgi:hypothetical protein